VFEVVSALGGTGYSLGWPGITQSLSAEFRIPSKLIVIAVMIIGRNRVLVDSIDRAVQLDWNQLEEENSNKLLSLTSFD
jgi:Trk-type K+ transport system membrane component